jgi:hypothetical protein
VGGRHWHWRVAEGTEPHINPRIGEAYSDFNIELIDQLYGMFFASMPSEILASQHGRNSSRASTSVEIFVYRIWLRRPEKSEREHAADAPVNAAFDSECWRHRPRGLFAPIARAPSPARGEI